MTNYTLNPTQLAQIFCVPTAVVDNHIKLASPTQIRVLLYMLRHLSENIDEGDIALFFGLESDEVCDALNYWASAGILNCESIKAKAVTEQIKPKKARITSEKPSRQEVARRGAEDEKLQFLLREVQIKFGRTLRQNEAATLVWLYDDEGMDIPVILTLIEYAVRQNKTSVRFIESTAVKWINEGVQTIADADRLINSEAKCELAWKVAAAAFGIKDRKPSKTEKENAAKWVNEYGFNREILEKAYDICVDFTGSYTPSYIKSVLERWHKDGVKTVNDISTEKKKPTKKGKNGGDYAAYDKDLVAQLLDEE